MLAVWECRLGSQAPIGSYLDPTFSFGIRPTISRKPLSAFETRSIPKLKILRHVTSCNPHQRERHLKHLPGSNCNSYGRDRKSTRLNSSHLVISYAVFCLKKKNKLIA